VRDAIDPANKNSLGLP